MATLQPLLRGWWSVTMTTHQPPVAGREDECEDEQMWKEYDVRVLGTKRRGHPVFEVH